MWNWKILAAKYYKKFNFALLPAFCQYNVPVAQPLFKDTEKKISEIENVVINGFKILIFSCING
jgi:hypothetical protein